MQGADQEEPAEAEGISPDELPVRLESFAQSLVMQDERNLHRGERNDEGGHGVTAGRQIIEHVRHVAKIGEEERKTQEQRAREHDQTEPAQDETKPAHGKTEKRSFPEMQPLDPRQADRDQVNLKVNRAEIFENKRHRIDRAPRSGEDARGKESARDPAVANR